VVNAHFHNKKQHIESRSRVSILQSQKKVDGDSSGNDEAMTKLIERKKKMNRNVMNRMTSNSNWHDFNSKRN
jgi:hypothetical protein